MEPRRIYRKTVGPLAGFSGTHLVSAALALLGALGAARAQDPTADLIRRLTDESSNAGQRGDQATVDRLTDPMVLFSAGDGQVQRDEKLDVDDDLSATIKAWTIALHSAATGFGLPFVDRSAVFIDETGAADPRGDFNGGAARLDDWVAHHTLDVAVTSFTLDTGSVKVRSVEVWSLQDGQWRLVAGQSIPLNQDPPPVDLEAGAVGVYAGEYSAGPGSVVRVERGPAGLTYSSQAGKPSALVPMGSDRFFTPGLPPGYLRPVTRFTRDGSGAVTGFERHGIVYRRLAAHGMAPGAPPVPGSLTLRDFTVRTFGNVAVAAFFHDRDSPYFGQVLHQSYRSMEAWISRDGRWTMISSQGREVERQP